jgi:hypothetical protein
VNTHFGSNGLAMCGASRLLASATTSDIQAVDCFGCLFVLWGNGLDAIDKVANRVRLLIAEQKSERLVQ